MNKQIKFAIIGYGNIGKRHAEHILGHPEAQLVAVCDIRSDVAKELNTELSFYQTIEEMVAQEAIDVMCICTPNYLHEEHCIFTLKNGIHAVVEKPMALSAAACDRMIAAEKESGKTIFAVKQNRYNPPVKAVKELLEKQTLGKIIMVQVNCFWNRNDSYYAQSNWRGKKALDGGCLFTQFSHFVDILYYLNGPITATEGYTQNYLHTDNTEFEDSGVFVMKAQNGALVNFNFTTCAFEKNKEGSITILAQNGIVKIGGQYLNTIEYQNIKETVLPEVQITDKANNYGHYEGSMSNHDQVIQNVLDVLFKDQKIMTSATEAKAVIQLIEAMYAAVK